MMNKKPKNYEEPSVFKPANLLREARRQKHIDNCNIPEICVLDPDGDLVEYLIQTKQAALNKCWACYHSKLYTVKKDNVEFGIIGNGVGASFAVLIAEQLFVSGCETLISITSAGIIDTKKVSSEFILINQALRDEGTSYHYIPPDQTSNLSFHLKNTLQAYFKANDIPVESGCSWTTDAPYRETPQAIKEAIKENAVCVEMEAAALYAFAKAQKREVVCYAHLTNTMAQEAGDFEKGEEMGSIASIKLITHTIQALKQGKKHHWERLYETHLPEQESWTQEIPKTSLELIHSTGLNKTAGIIDVGGGDSRLVDFLLEEGYENITVLDISKKAIERVKHRLGTKAKKVKWIVKDITKFEPSTDYDLWHDRAAFHFLTKNSEIEKYRQTVKNHVTGYLIIGTFSTRGPKKCSGLDVTQYDEQSLTEKFKSDFYKLKCFTIDHITPFNTKQNFIFWSFKKNQKST